MMLNVIPQRNVEKTKTALKKKGQTDSHMAAIYDWKVRELLFRDVSEVENA